MPCTYEESADEIRARAKKEQNRLTAPYRAELNLVTRLLCEVMTELHKPYAPEPKLKDFKNDLDILS